MISQCNDTRASVTPGDKPDFLKMFVGDNGDNGKPAILIVSGIHGSEQLAVVSSIRMVKNYTERLEKERFYVNSAGEVKESHPEFLTGSITLLAGMNPYGMVAGTREFKEEPVVNPGLSDKPNLNRAFNVDQYQYRYTFGHAVNVIKNSIDNADIVIDVHNSPVIHNCVLIDNGPFAKNYVEFCKKFGIPFILREGPAGTIKSYAIAQGKVGFTVELSGMGDCPNQDELVSGQVAFLNTLVDAAMHVYGPNSKPVLCNATEMEEFQKSHFLFTDFMRTRIPFPPYCLATDVIYRGKFGFVEYGWNATKPNSTAYGEGAIIGVVHCVDGSEEQLAMPIGGYIVDFKEHANVAEPGKTLYTVQPVYPVDEVMKHG